MKAVILAGGLGTRLSEETATRPKPMVEIGGRPMLWHIMKGYSRHGINDFVICLGYKGYVIKEYFSNYFLHMSDVTLKIAENRMEIHRKTAEPWTVTLVDTGEHSMTGGRLKRIRHHLEDEEFFAFTYGDGVSDIDFTAQIDFHRAHGKRATVTAVRPDKRFGYLSLDGTQVTAFEEKPDNEGGWINGGFFLLAPSVIDTIAGDETIWEREPLESLAQAGELQAFVHDGFWQAMDTLRDKMNLEALWASGRAPWKTW
ncbi:glucose-1-phosphate cytidylyltransferase [Methylobacterium phyllostachyos]|uniref:Glucose-1-phosphate cytidylyltransferase n=1 Tax=Methylobacterium phyllostachyos TaxID=582672 RepID=A0A1H0GGP8_9HYPH|nr:glucose-1-phosphate cytidylyltransferase [Methylobacterium phyllostachyos]SDO05909.1 glucose-1-phosphate cytidylyltransferase [Methylobacterium phyllostachyos]